MDGIINLSIVQMIFAYVLVIITLIIIKVQGVHREKEVIISNIRMTLQLTITGYILVYIFEKPHPIITFGLIFIMEIFAIYTVLKKFKDKINKKLKKVIAISMFLGTFTSILYFLFIIVRVNPWYNPQYFIPISGMLIGNSMTGVSLCIKHLSENMYIKRSVIEEKLMLGATPKTSVKDIIASSFDSAILPTINSMLGMGIIFLPGMMTGQILSGTSPVTAISYQIAIMIGIFTTVIITTVMVLNFGYKTYFNEELQLIH